jgi:DNA-binding CsgD family transcriptional regulator
MPRVTALDATFRRSAERRPLRITAARIVRYRCSPAGDVARASATRRFRQTPRRISPPRSGSTSETITSSSGLSRRMRLRKVPRPPLGPGAERRGERGLGMLQLLIPAFEAGVRIQLERSAARAALASLFDRLGRAVAVYSAVGTPLHRTEALNALLLAEPEADRLREHVDVLARALAARLSVPSGTADPPDPADARARVTTGTADYRLLGSYLNADSFGNEAVLVLIERLQPLFSPVVDLRSRFALTVREAEVALLLAEGLTDGAIAARLDLSPHTARRYSERVLGKLGLHSRAAVAIILLRGASGSTRPGARSV